MTTAAERLLSLAGTTGTAAALLLAIGTGATAGGALVNYSGMASGTAAEHLLVEKQATHETYSGGWFDFPDRPRRLEQARKVIKRIRAIQDDHEDLDELREEAEGISRQLAEVIKEFEALALEKQRQLDIAKEQEQILRLRSELIDAQIKAEFAYMQREELDVAWLAMMIAAQI